MDSTLQQEVGKYVAHLEWLILEEMRFVFESREIIYMKVFLRIFVSMAPTDYAQAAEREARIRYLQQELQTVKRLVFPQVSAVPTLL